MRGCTFRTGKEQSTMVSAGPMSRHAEDLLPLLKVLVCDEKKTSLRLDENVDLKKLRYFYISENGVVASTPVNSETQNQMKKVTRYFEELTEQDVVKTKLPGLEKSKNMWRYWMTQEPANFNRLMGNGDEINPIVELLKKLVGQSDFSMAGIFGLIDGILPAEKEKIVKDVTQKLEEALNELLGDDGILFFHSNPRTAPFHYHPLFLKFNDFHYFSIFNVLKVPVTQVPLGLDSNGLPLGIQVVATKNRDRHCIAVAQELERAFGGWVPPFQN
uniref:Amidase domain-containing protein n=1 Tax=Megaselia scalaris TaxID=36166 RepID=T1GBS8_MEGSC